MHPCALLRLVGRSYGTAAGKTPLAPNGVYICPWQDKLGLDAAASGYADGCCYGDVDITGAVLSKYSYKVELGAYARLHRIVALGGSHCAVVHC